MEDKVKEVVKKEVVAQDEDVYFEDLPEEVRQNVYRAERTGNILAYVVLGIFVAFVVASIVACVVNF